MSKILKHKITKEQRRHLAILAKRLLTHRFDVEFDMENFATGDSEDGSGLLHPHEAAECGTTCCALGHAPLIPALPVPLTGETWSNYSNRIIGLLDATEPFRFLFGSRWPNVKAQFAARALVFLKRGGYPAGFNEYLDSYPAPKPTDFNRWIQ